MSRNKEVNRLTDTRQRRDQRTNYFVLKYAGKADTVESTKRGSTEQYTVLYYNINVTAVAVLPDYEERRRRRSSSYDFTTYQVHLMISVTLINVCMTMIRVIEHRGRKCKYN